MNADPLHVLASKRHLALTFRRAKTFEERFYRRFDSVKYGDAFRAAMKRVRLP